MLKLIDFFASKAKTNRVFIIPTFLGIKLLIVNIILLSMGLIYANNYLILFNFIFFCLFIISMFYTHFNLYGLELLNIECSENFAGESLDLNLKFNTPNRQKYPAIFAKFAVNKNKLLIGPFTIDENGNSSSMSFKIPQRGHFNVSKISLETSFPLNLFKAFCFFKTNLEIVVYPSLINSLKSGTNTYASNINEEIHFELRNYIRGDKLNRIAWKKSREDDLKTKIEINDDGSAVVFNLDQSNLENIEYELSLIASSIKNCHDNGISYGLNTALHRIQAQSPSVVHLKKTLRILAEYES